jgi:hypothetical protein
MTQWTLELATGHPTNHVPAAGSSATGRPSPIRLLTFLSVAAWLTLWHVRSTGRFVVEVPLYAIAFVAVCAIYGTLVERTTSRFVPARLGAAYCLLTGFFAFNTLLFILTLASPFGILVNVAVLSVLPTALLVLPTLRKNPPSRATLDELPGLVCVLIGGMAATLWATEFQPVTEFQDRAVVFRAETDIFIHVREISSFAQAHGWATMSNIKMVGSAAPIYHFASYVSTAAFSTLTSTSALVNFGGFQLPFGILLVSIASFVLVGALWRPWPAVAAVVAVAAFPDAYEQGFGAGYLGFNYMSQVNIGMLYGIAIAAVMWVFMIEGCRRSSYGTVVVAYGLLAVTVFYKAHVFVANAYLILIFPCLFFAGLRWRWRLVSLAVMTSIFVLVVAISQMSPNVPTLRLDGSGAGAYMRLLYLGFDAGVVKRALDWLLFQHQFGRGVDAITGTVLIVFGSFGIWVLASPFAFWRLRDRLSPSILAFVVMVVVNYWIMSIGLAMDERGIGAPEELLNRPMAWAYFVLVSFAGAALYQLALGDGGPSSRRNRVMLGSVVVILLCGVAFHSHNAQTFPPLPAYREYAQFNALPLCEVRAAEFIRDHGRVSEVVQDSGNDPHFATTAISERQAYVVESSFAGKAMKQEARLATLRVIDIMGDVQGLDALSRRDGIDWYLLHPDQELRWPRSFLDRAAFTCDGYRVIRLSR